MNISNKFLAFLVVLAITLSTVSTLSLLNRISMLQPTRQVITGRATPHLGNVTVEVQSAVSITLDPDFIDFGTGFVNTSKCGTNATLTAGRYYEDYNDCWTSVGTPPTEDGGFNLTNDGNRNVTVCVVGPDRDTFFDTYPGSNPYDLNWSTYNISGCARTWQTTNISFSGTNSTVCADLLWEAGMDRIGVDVMVVIPADLDPGTYSNASFDFTAFQSDGSSTC